jgi:streptogramin lyase
MNLKAALLHSTAAAALVLTFASTAWADIQLVVVDAGLDAILLVDPISGDRTVLSSSSVGSGTNFLLPRGIAQEANGDFVVCDADLDAIVRVDGTTGDRTIISSAVGPVGSGTGFDTLFDIAVEDNGNIIVADTGLLALLRVNPSTGDRTVLSSSSVGTGSAFINPSDIGIESDGNIIVTDGSGTDILVRVEPSNGNRSLLSGTGPAFENLSGVSFEADGSIIVSDTTTDSIYHVNPLSGDRTIISSNSNSGPAFGTILAITTGSNGNFIVVETTGDHALNRVNASTGDHSVVSGTGTGTGTNFISLHDVIEISDPVEPVPTLPVWGLALMSGLLLAAGGQMLSYRRPIMTLQ